MGCARPILLAVGGEAKQLVDDARCGWVVPPENVDAMVAGIEAAHTHRFEARARGRAGRAFVEAHFDRKVLADRYLDELEGAFERGRAR
jgi:glycosyltransferase involved in cell wall biosynthesis